MNNMEPIYIFIDQNSINEASGYGGIDKRVSTSVSPFKDTIAPIKQMTATKYSIGGTIKSALQLGAGYIVKVFDFNEAVSIEITYNNIKTGKSASANFVVVIWSPGMYRTYSSATTYRTSKDYNQAITYIKNKAQSLQGKTS